MGHYPLKESYLDRDSQDFFTALRAEAEQIEEKSYHPHAARSKDHSRYYGPEEDHRLPYKRDVDRIVHSKAYARYSDKTQVIYLVDNDHITQRGLHVQLVSHFARGVAEILRLNLDLVEAVSLGHDVGHPPFGHEGERYLSHLSQEGGNGPFTHPWQSCRLLKKIEPLNLGLAVYDGFLCHDGGLKEQILHPQFDKSWEEHEKELLAKRENPDIPLMPMTLEGCLVRISDTISYTGRDIEDAVQLGIIRREEIPKTCLGNTNREILSRAAQSLIRESYGKDYIALSKEVFEALQTLRQFNFDNIYTHPRLKIESDKLRRSYQLLFISLIEDHEQKKGESHISKEFLVNKSEEYLGETTEMQAVVDYIAGMTDNYFIRTLENLALPQRIRL